MFKNTFDLDLEKSYREDIYYLDLSLIRFSLILGAVFYGLFGFLDVYVAVASLNIFLIIRFGIVIPAISAVFFWTFFSSFKKWHQLSLTSVYILAGLGIMYMLYLHPNNFSYYGGIFLIFAVGFFMMGVYWYNIFIGTLAIIAVHLLLVFINGVNIKNGIGFAFFYLGFSIICAYASYKREKYRRQIYGQHEVLKGDKVILERNLYDQLMEVENANRITIFSLARLAESRDHFTGDHIERVGALCLKVANNLDESYYIENGANKVDIVKTIEFASTLHDIGKVAIPEYILMKPGKLTVAEMDVMKQHTIYGYETLLKIKANYGKNDFINMGIDICRYHHERWNGKGYPEQLKGQAIPLSARIVSVVDVFDALISERPYKKAFTVSHALSIMEEESGNQFDPTILKLFLELQSSE